LKTVKTEDLDLDVDNASHPTKREHAIPGAIKRDTAANIAGGKQVCVDGNVYVVVDVVVVVNVLVIAHAVPGAIKRDTAANIAGGKQVSWLLLLLFSMLLLLLFLLFMLFRTGLRGTRWQTLPEENR
jgi:uncharacterized membrane protein